MDDFLTKNGRKFVLFILTLIVLGVLIYFGKIDGLGYIVGLYCIYTTGNVGTKIANRNSEGK